MNGKLHRAMKPDAQGFDEVRIVTVPRFKESELSGDEWRISAAIEFYRKGRCVHRIGWGSKVENAVHGLGYHFLCAHDDGKAFFAGEEDYCDQEGCANHATVTYRLKKGFTRDGTERELSRDGEYRMFCDRHKHRGDCGLEDADNNYEIVL